jgi:putative endonuclease
MNQYYTYILASKHRNLYIGVTNDLERRMYEHKNKLLKGHTKKYNIDRLVYFETFGDITQAINREKQLKGWSRKRNDELIEVMNQDWKDLSEEWFKSEILSIPTRDSSLRSE